jgi:hypothetical protein
MVTTRIWRGVPKRCLFNLFFVEGAQSARAEPLFPGLDDHEGARYRQIDRRRGSFAHRS